MSNISLFEVKQDHYAVTGFLKAMNHSLKAFAQGIAHARQMHRDYLTLAAMSGPELQDIGISRSDISAVVAGKWPNVTFQKTQNANIGIQSSG